MYQYYESQAFTYLALACLLPAAVVFFQMRNIGNTLLMFGYCATVFLLCSKVAVFLPSWADQDLLIFVGLATIVLAIQTWRNYRRN